MSSPSQPVRRLIDGEWSPSRLHDHLREVGTPLVETVDDDRCEVTFVHELDAADSGAEVRLRSLIDRSLPGDPVLMAIPGTGFRHLTLRLPSSLRFSYAFEVQRPDGSRARVEDSLNRHVHRPDSRLGSAVAVLPAAQPLPFLETREDAPAPHLEELRIRSRLLDAERRVWVSLPPGVGDTASPLPFVIVFDGSPVHSAPAVRDALVRAGLIREAAVILVDQEDRREQDLTADPLFSGFLATELAPSLRERYGFSADPADAVLSGSSFGGLCAGWTALQHPEVFGGAIMQSPSCWHHPDLGRPGEAPPAATTTPTPTLITAFQAASPPPIRLFHEVGELEFGPPPAKVWQILGNRWLSGVLAEKGYDTVYREFAGGHDAAWWRGTWAEGMRWMLPARARP